MMQNSAILIALTSILLPGIPTQGNLAPSPTQKTPMESALELVKQRMWSIEGGNRGEKLAQAEQQFSALLDQIADGASPGASERKDEFPVRSTLLRIAKDRKKNRESYLHIYDKYVKFRPVENRAQCAPALESEDATEEFRLAWEYVLLAPLHGLGEYEWRAINALSRIKNPASLETLTGFYRVTCQPMIPVRLVATKQIWTLDGISRFSSPEALKALIECLEASAEQKARDGAVDAFDAEKALLDIWSAQKTDPDAKNRWKRIVSEFSVGALSEDQARIFSRISKAWD